MDVDEQLTDVDEYLIALWQEMKVPYMGTFPVSYTHLDVYKRQASIRAGHYLFLCACHGTGGI